jgi:peptidoglycan/xylan/chitin deacetylase (PgdA/CDA1 family)
LKNFLFPIFSLVKPVIPLKIRIGLSGQKLIFPFYHAVTDVVPPHLDQLYKIKAEKEFEKDLDFLLRNFIPVSLEEVVNTNKKITRPSFHLSFDDGLREVCDYIEPVLTRKGIPATFFINPDFVDNKELFFRYKASVLIHFAGSYQKEYWKDFHEYCEDHNIAGKNIREICLSVNYQERQMLDDIASVFDFSFPFYLNEYQPYLNTIQLKSLAAKGFTLGAHSLDHPD